MIVLSNFVDEVEVAFSIVIIEARYDQQTHMGHKLHIMENDSRMIAL